MLRSSVLHADYNISLCKFMQAEQNEAPGFMDIESGPRGLNSMKFICMVDRMNV